MASSEVALKPTELGVQSISKTEFVVVVVVLLFYVHGKHLSSCREGQLTFSWAGLVV